VSEIVWSVLSQDVLSHEGVQVTQELDRDSHVLVACVGAFLVHLHLNTNVLL